MGSRGGQPSRDTSASNVPPGGMRRSTPSRRIYRFTYYDPPRDEKLSLHELRDSDAFVELSPLLYDGTLSYGGLVLNYPAPRNHDPNVIIPVDESLLTPSDLLVLTTRPPLDDTEEDKKRIRRSFTSLEHKVFDALRLHFPKCSRSYVQLAPRLRDAFPEDRANRAHVEYRVHGPFASYKARRDYRRKRWDKGDGHRTGAYLIYQKPAWPGGPSLLAAFGMSGPLTLLWTHFLGTRPNFSTVLAHARFLMAEIEIQDIPRKAESLRFSDNWTVETLLDYSLAGTEPDR
jgi:hypothetical protein